MTAKGSVSTHRKAKEGTSVRFGPPGFGDGALRIGEFRFAGLGTYDGPFATPNEVQIDSSGRVLRETGESQLPQAYGALSRLVIEQLPPAGKNSFEHTKDCVLLTEEKQYRTSTTYTLKEGEALVAALKPPPLPKLESKAVTADERATLIADLKPEDSAFPARWSANEALGHLKDARAAEPLAKLLADRKDPLYASSSLKALGAEAEDAVLKLVQHEKPEVRRDACGILEVIATAKSLPALQEASSDSDALTARFAKEAVRTAKDEK